MSQKLNMGGWERERSWQEQRHYLWIFTLMWGQTAATTLQPGLHHTTHGCWAHQLSNYGYHCLREEWGLKSGFWCGYFIIHWSTHKNPWCYHWKGTSNPGKVQLSLYPPLCSSHILEERSILGAVTPALQYRETQPWSLTQDLDSTESKYILSSVSSLYISI